MNGGEHARRRSEEQGSRRRLRPALLVAFSAFSAFSACAGAEESTPGSTDLRPELVRDLAPPEVLLLGCTAYISGACVVLPGTTEELRLWVDVHPQRPIVVTLDGVEVEPEERVAAESGQRLVMDLPEGARELALRTRGHASWSLALVPGAPEDASAAREAKRSGDAAFMAGEHRRALADYGRAMDGFVALDLDRPASDVALTATYLCAETLLDMGCARSWLARHRSLFADFPEAELRHGLYAGMLAERSGDLRLAIREYRAHADTALRLGLDYDAAAALSADAVLRARLGDLEGSEAALRRAIALMAEGKPSARARLLINIAWAWILARDRGLRTQDPRPLLRDAIAIVQAEAQLEEPAFFAPFRVNLAFAELLEGRLEQARALLGELAGGEMEPRQRLWRDYLGARLLFAEGELGPALEGFSALAGRADMAQREDLRIRALVGRGSVLAAQGRREEAAAGFLAAERELDARLSELAVDGSRERYASINDRSSREAVSLLLELGRPREALCVARLARSRTYDMLTRSLRHRSDRLEAVDGRQRALARYLETRSLIEAEVGRSWGLPRHDGERLRAEQARLAATNLRELDVVLAEIEVAPVATMTCEELPRPGEGELLVSLLPAAQGWVGFALRGPDVVVEALTLPDREASYEAWAQALLDPFAEMIADADRLRIVTTGELLEVPIHRLPFGGAPLFETLPVVYSLDLAAEDRYEGPRSREALGVAPSSNLLHAEAEADEVALALEEGEWRVESLSGESATGALVRDHLGTSGLLHFVGHARADRAAGWDDALQLGAGGELTVTDLLASPTATPHAVVLNGCRTGLADPGSAAGGMSLAHALLVAGSEVVIATTRDVDDAYAHSLMVAFYTELLRAPEADFATALAAALSVLYQGGACDEDDCTGYRAWVR